MSTWCSIRKLRDGLALWLHRSGLCRRAILAICSIAMPRLTLLRQRRLRCSIVLCVCLLGLPLPLLLL
jgi:hypothetical protein